MTQDYSISNCNNGISKQAKLMRLNKIQKAKLYSLKVKIHLLFSTDYRQFVSKFSTITMTRFLPLQNTMKNVLPFIIPNTREGDSMGLLQYYSFESFHSTSPIKEILTHFCYFNFISKNGVSSPDYSVFSEQIILFWSSISAISKKLLARTFHSHMTIKRGR